MRVLISQERPGHTETIASFVQNFSELGHAVDVCSPDAYQNLTLYQEQGMKFSVVGDEVAWSGLRDGKYGAVVFNSAHLTMEGEGGPFSLKLVKQLDEMKFDRRRVFRLHHSFHSAKTLSKYVELGTTSLMAAVTEFCYTPYARIDGFTPNVTAPICIGLLGGAYQGARVHRNLEKVRALAERIDQNRSPVKMKWFLTKATPEISSLLADFRCFEIREGLSTAEILSELSQERSFMGTFLNRETRYHKQSLTGTLTFAVNAGIPVVLDQQLASIYGLGGVGMLEYGRAVDMEERFLSLTDNEYLQSVSSLASFRKRQIQANVELIGAILSKSI